MILSLMLAAASPQPTVCGKLSGDYENASKRLAMIFAEGVNDNSAVRATMRESQESNIRTDARETLELMKLHKCKLPTSTPNAGPYVTQAMRCRLDRLKQELNPTGTIPESCDSSKWKDEHAAEL
ncbi:hypothetical protein [Sphingopyxis sp.]|jgi:hypothetical protein|uniref:hypothetical protein n=1 Tax=Sphingopyxis sp. TaxID=1908224 RepID=UPI003F71B0C9